MGAESFITTAHGKTAKEAFTNAQRDARHWHGHGGYTGTIAEKSEFVAIALPEGRKPEEYADELINAGDKRIDSKWGPAGCINVGDDKWLFFGWASS